MAINITDGFNLNYAAPVDYRIVVDNSTARLALTYKYDGLKVFQLDNRTTYIYNLGGITWDIENSDKISGSGDANYIPKFTGINPVTGSSEIGNSTIFSSGSNVGINTNNPTGAYTYLQIGGTNLTEDPYWYAGQSLPLTIHKGASSIIGYNWYWTGSTDAYFNSAVGSSQMVFSEYSISFKTRPGSGSFVYNMIIYPGYVIFSDNIPSGSTKSPMIRSQGSTSYSSQTTPDFTWWNSDQTGIFMPSAGTIAFTNYGTESVRIKSNGYVGIGNSTATYKLTVSGLVQGYSDTSKTVGGQVLNVGSSTWFSDVHLLTGQVDGTNNGFIQVTYGDTSYDGSNIGLTPYNLEIQPGGGKTIFPIGSVSEPSIIFSSSSNTGIFAPSANIIAFSTNGTESVRITASGSVGIGGNPTTIYSSADLFSSSSPKLEIITGEGASAYQELMTLRHSNLSGGLAGLRRLGYIMKMSNEGDSNESNKMGGMILESSLSYANYPSLYLVTSNLKRMQIDSNGNTIFDIPTSAATHSIASKQMILSINDLYANVHNRGTNGIGDSGNVAVSGSWPSQVGPWTYPSVASGLFSISNVLISPTNATHSGVKPLSWIRVGNVVSVSSQVMISITTANTLTEFKLPLPLKSYFNATTGNSNNWQLNGVGKVVGNYGSATSYSGDVITIQASGSPGYAHFKFKPSSSGSITIVYQYQYTMGSWPTSFIADPVILT